MKQNIFIPKRHFENWCGCRRKDFGSCGCFVWVESAKAFPGLVALHLHFVPHCLIENCSPLTNYNRTDSHRWSSLSAGKETCLQSVACRILIRILKVIVNRLLNNQFVLYVDPVTGVSYKPKIKCSALLLAICLMLHWCVISKIWIALPILPAFQMHFPSLPVNSSLSHYLNGTATHRNIRA